MTTNTKTGVLAMAAFVSSIATGCNDHPLKEVTLESVTNDGGIVDVVQRKDVDILFVIDNSGSMGEEQATLAANFGAFIGQLEEPHVDANYRIAVTTTDAEHAYCRGGERGNFVLSSCRSREVDFQRQGTVGAEDNFFDAACLSHCELDTLQTTPTKTLEDDVPRPRPWIERIGGQSNLPEGVTTTQAFQCVGPQGVAGCGYESPLEGMKLALTRASTDTENEYGFMRPGAILAVVFVTDEADCSARWSEIEDPWLPDGMQTFWDDANKGNSQPFSEVCWYAGVECTDTGGGRKDCKVANKDAAGEPADPEDAVLFPVERYTTFLQEIEDAKREIDAGAGLENSDVLVAVIDGVPTGYMAGDPVPYGDGLTPQDEEFQQNNGIAPGCRTEGVGEAVPPVRLKAFADAFATSSDETNLFSVCDPDYTPALKEIAKRIADQTRPACVPLCVEDSDPTTPTVEHNCVITEQIGEDESTVPPCEVDGEDAIVPDGADLCYLSLSDKTGSTDETIDDIEDDCREVGWNLQLKVVRRDGVREEPGSSIRAQCSASQRRSVDCPDLR